MNKLIRILSIAFLFIILNGAAADTFAQCAMCQATVESNLDGGGDAGKSLNSGIMYLLAAPYIAMLGVGYLWYKKYKKKSVVIDMKRD